MLYIPGSNADEFNTFLETENFATLCFRTGKYGNLLNVNIVALEAILKAKAEQTKVIVTLPTGNRLKFREF